MNTSTTKNSQAISDLAVCNAVPAASATLVTLTRVFDLTGTSITMIERTTCDEYTGPLCELQTLGLIRVDQLPPEGSNAISWIRGERAKRGRIAIDETYVRVWIAPKVASVSFGVTKTIQQARLRVRKEEDAARYESRRVERLQSEAAEQAQVAEWATRDLANVPRSEDAFLREEAKSVRRLMMISVKLATEESSCHGYCLDSESLDEICSSIDSVVEAFLNARVVFDAQRHAEAIAGFQRKVLAAAPSMAAKVKALAVPNTGILQGEAA